MEEILNSPTMTTLQRVNQLLSEIRCEIKKQTETPTQDKKKHSESNAILNMIEMQLDEINNKRYDIVSGKQEVFEIYNY